MIETARPRWPAANPLRDEALLLRKPTKHINRHGLARLKYPGWRRRAVGRNENAEGDDIEKDAERSAPMNYAGDRDEIVLLAHRTSHVRTIRAPASEICFSVGAVPYGFPTRSLRTGETSVVGTGRARDSGPGPQRGAAWRTRRCSGGREWPSRSARPWKPVWVPARSP
jgi:hypothetical protein